MKIAIIGAGASGLFLAARLSEASDEKDYKIVLIEKNEKIGKKLFITGKGRCNITNNCDIDVFFNNVVTNKKFLYSCVSKFPPQAVIDYFEKGGLALKTERGNRVFPNSDKSSDVIKFFDKHIKNGVELKLNSTVKGIKTVDDSFVISCGTEEITCDKVVIACGGASYRSTGSCGDGYTFARSLGHKVIQPKAALVPIEIENFNANLAGLSLKNVSLNILREDKLLASEFGELLFTHKGLSGPIALTISSLITKHQVNGLKAVIDLKPALDEEKLNARLLREFEAAKNKNLKNIMPLLVPRTLIDIVLAQSGLNGDICVNSIIKEQRIALVKSLKNLTFKIKTLASLDEAIITSGGVDIKEVNPTTMESKLVKNLYFVGEILDVDALTGGFNLQIAFSTAQAAANAILLS